MKSSFLHIPLIAIIALQAGCSLDAECGNSETRCFTDAETNKSYQQTCLDGLWDEKTQVECSNSCLKDQSRCGECLNGDTKCQEDTAYLCKDGKWRRNADSNECKPGGGKCDQEDNMKCYDSSLYRCTNGEWTEDSPCDKGLSCNKDGTDCGNCINGTEKCEDDKSFLCIDGAWDKETPCPNETTCNSDNTACEHCEAEAQKCIVNKLFTCVDKQWDEGTECEGNASCSKDGLQCGQCRNNDKNCENDENNHGIQRTCSYGEWDEGIECGNASCLENGTECGDCVNDADKCENRIRYLCENGRWIESGECQPLTPSTNECTNDKTKCENGVKYTCINGSWGNIIGCKSNECNADGTDCNRCEESKTKCEKGIKYICTDGDWGNASPCPSLLCDSTGEDCSECSENDAQCSEGKLRTCQNGRWGIEEECANKSCKSDKECGECQEGAIRCQDGVRQTCTNGAWNKGTKCSTSACNPPATDCADCTEGKTKCDSGKLNTCTNGVWDKGTACQNNASCKSTTACGDCKTGSHLDCGSYIGVKTFKPCVDATKSNKTEYCDYGSSSCENCTPYVPHVRKVTADSINVRSTPSLNGSVITQVTENAEIVVFGQTKADNRNWLLIKFEYREYNSAWVSAEEFDCTGTLSPTSDSDMTQYVSSFESYKAKNCTSKRTVNGPLPTSNLRLTPSENSTNYVIKEVDKGTQITTCGQTGDWIKLLYNNQIAYMNKNQMN